ncbi:Ig-like domain-containing protein [candidate division KSB1 bacterium]
MTRIYTVLSLTIFLQWSLMFSCAVQGRPQGGPEDTLLPTVISVVPPDTSTAVSVDLQLEIQFSERMNKPTVESAIFISPVPSTVPEYSWNKNRLIVRFTELLDIDRTYVINIGTNAEDTRRNNLAESYTWAFSTGDSLDKGQFYGRVHGAEPLSGLLVWAYPLDGGSDPDPFLMPGDYITQTGEEGGFRFSYLKEGRYRIFAVSDGNKNMLYESFADRIAIPTGDIDVGPTLNALPYRFQHVQYDTVGPRIYSVEAANRHVLQTSFSERVTPETATSGHFRILAYPSGDIIQDAVKAVIQPPEAETSLIIYIENLSPGSDYQLEINDISDASGNTVTQLRDSSTVFRASEDPDTTRLLITGTSPPDSSIDISVNSSFILQFNSPVTFDEQNQFVNLTDSLDNEIAFRLSHVSPARIEIDPVEPLESLMEYTLTVDTLRLRNLSGMYLHDEKENRRYITRDIRRTGELTGSVRLSGEDPGIPLLVLIEAESSGGDSSMVRLDSPGEFTFAGLLPGNYRLWAYSDLDENGTWSSGTLRPFQHSEPFTVYEGSIAIRAGIENTVSPLELLVY